MHGYIQEDMQGIHRPHKENLQKNVQNPQWGREAPPTPPKAGLWILFIFFVDFPCVSVDIPAYHHVHIGRCR